MLDFLLRWLVGEIPALPERTTDAKLVHRIDLTVDASCPCGSTLIHHLTLMSTADCPRCGRTLAIRAIEYHRTSPASVPIPVISIGWVHSTESLRHRRTRGVH